MRPVGSQDRKIQPPHGRPQTVVHGCIEHLPFVVLPHQSADALARDNVALDVSDFAFRFVESTYPFSFIEITNPFQFT